MGDRSVTICCTGDIHLGRRPSRVPAEADEYSVAYVWRHIVDAAIEADVDVVALTGDVVDQDSAYYQAIGPLERGLRRLHRAGISTFAVAGNHDYDVLPRLVDAMGAEGFYLLGRGGRWEQQMVERDGSAVLRLVGWSFPTRHVHRSPLDSFDLGFDEDIPTVGLLHADLDQRGSEYAPVTSAQLEESRHSTWLLGHIHRPAATKMPGGGLILYPGSPQPLHPGEPGVHGPWLVDVEAGCEAVARQLPLATLRYRELAIELDGVDEEVELEQVVPEAVRRDLSEIADGSSDLRRLVYRLRYVGRTALHRRLEALSERIIDDLEISFGRASATIDAVTVESTPKIDLEALAGNPDPPGVLAALLIQVRDDAASEAAQKLVRKMRTGVETVHRSGAYGPLRSDPATSSLPDDDWIRQRLLAEGLRLLDTLLAEKPDGVSR